MWVVCMLCVKERVAFTVFGVLQYPYIPKANLKFPQDTGQVSATDSRSAGLHSAFKGSCSI